MLKTAFSDLFEETRRYGINDGLVSELIEDYEEEYGSAPRSYADLLEVLE
ncbi:MAG: hypothetical protein RE471_03120 [Ferroplasma sp.]|jgi:hypothetical protein|nr:hypothetical protein [Ferroplasma sp.]WMT51879.1 MAG: hypothetical protein RE471_03120 [Ferroplasma sp.]